MGKATCGLSELPFAFKSAKMSGGWISGAGYGGTGLASHSISHLWRFVQGGPNQRGRQGENNATVIA